MLTFNFFIPGFRKAFEQSGKRDARHILVRVEKCEIISMKTSSNIFSRRLETHRKLPESDELKKMRFQRRKLVEAQQKHNLVADSGDQLSG